MVEHRRDRKQDDDNRSGFDVHTCPVQCRTCKVAEISETKRPGESPEKVIGNKLAVCHFADAGNDRDEGADNRYKAGQNNRDGAVLFVKLLGAYQVFFAEKAGVFPLEQFFPDFFAEKIASTLAKRGGQKEQEGENVDVDRNGTRQNTLLEKEAGREEQAVAREKEADEQSRFGINHEQNSKDAEAGDKIDESFHYYASMNDPGASGKLDMVWSRHFVKSTRGDILSSETDKGDTMSDQFVLAVEPRESLGKQVKKLRQEGLVPAVVHNHGKESTHIQVEYQILAKVVQGAGRHHPVELTIDGKKHTVLIRSVSRDPKLGTITHVVFNSVSANQKVEAEIPVKPHYAEGKENTPAERAGLIVLEQLDVVEVKALPKDLPNELYYDAEKLVAVGDHVTVADLVVPAGVEIETDPSHAVASVFEPSALAAANEAAAGEAEETAPAEDAPSDETAPAAEAKE